jgi:Tfp pilus assembly protein PilV
MTSTWLPIRGCRKLTPSRRGGCAGISLLEAVIALSILAVGLSGIFATNAQVLRMLGRSKETVAARQVIQGRLDRVRAATYQDVATPAYISSMLLPPGAAGDAVSSDSTRVLNGLTENVIIHALGQRLFTNAAARTAATPLRVGETASQLDAVAPATPTAYTATGTSAGAWTLATAFPRIHVRRTGTGSTASVAVLSSSDLRNYPQLRVDVQVSWTDAGGRARSQMSSMVLSKQYPAP